MDRALLLSTVITVGVVLVGVVVVSACAGKESPPDSADAAAHVRTAKAESGESGESGESAESGESSAEGVEAPATKAGAEVRSDQCEGLLLADDLSIHLRGQGSHGAATTDVTLDLKAGTLRGRDYKLDADGNTPIPLTVDQKVAPEVLAALRQHLESSCAPRRITGADEHSAPGGSTSLEITHADGTSLFVVPGASTIPKGATVASPSSAAWTTLFELWPKTEGK